jgi:replicative DNA helicase
MPNPKPNNTGLKTNLRTIKRSNDGDLGIEGKIIPQAVPVEEVVLGAIMIDLNAMSAVLDMLKPEVFYIQAHAKIFGAMMRIFNKTEPIDLLTVHEELKKSGELEEVGGAAYLAGLTSKVGKFGQCRTSCAYHRPEIYSTRIDTCVQRSHQRQL